MPFLALERQLWKRNAAEMLLIQMVCQKRNLQYYVIQQVKQTPGDRADTCLQWQVSVPSLALWGRARCSLFWKLHLCEGARPLTPVPVKSRWHLHKIELNLTAKPKDKYNQFMDDERIGKRKSWAMQTVCSGQSQMSFQIL